MKASARISVPSFSGLVQHLQPGFFPALGAMVGGWASVVLGQVLHCVISRLSYRCWMLHCSGKEVAEKEKGIWVEVVTLIHFPTSWSFFKCRLLSGSFQTCLKLQLISHSIHGLCFVLFFYSSYHHLTYYICYVFVLSFSSRQNESYLKVGTFHIWYDMYLYGTSRCSVFVEWING